MKIDKIIYTAVCLATLNGCIVYKNTITPRVERSSKLTVKEYQKLVKFGTDVTTGLTIVAIGSSIAAKTFSVSNINEWNKHRCTDYDNYCIVNQKAFYKTEISLKNVAFVSAITAAVTGTATGIYVVAIQNQNSAREVFITPITSGISLNGSF